MKLELRPAERRSLRARAHPLNPVVMIGAAGVTGTVLHEIDLALKHHELVKVRMLGEDRRAREAALLNICDALAAAPVQRIGKVLVVYRPKPEPPARAPEARAREEKPRPVSPSGRGRRPTRG